MIVRGNRNIKQNRNWLTFNSSFEISSIILTILKRQNLSLPLKVETDQFVICLVLPECLSVKICCNSPSDRSLLRSHLLRCHAAPPLPPPKKKKCGKNISDTLGYASCSTFLLLPHFHAICDLLLNRRTTTWNLFVNLSMLTYTEFDCVALLAVL